jgi:hypothetical protein
MRSSPKTSTHTNGTVDIQLSSWFDFFLNLFFGILFLPICVGLILLYQAYLAENVNILIDKTHQILTIRKKRNINGAITNEVIPFSEIEEIKNEVNVVLDIVSGKPFLSRNKKPQRVFLLDALMTSGESESIVRIVSQELEKAKSESASTV